VHEKELDQLEAERIVRADDHNSVLGKAEDRIRDQRDLLGQYQDQLKELGEDAKASTEHEKAMAREAS
jgi:hypothetical protein